MKYYLFQGTPGQMEERLFRHLKRIEPKAVELTKEDYEKRMGIVPKGAESKESKDVGQPVGEGAKEPIKAPVFIGRPEAIKILRARGKAYAELKSKTKAELNAML